MDLLRWGSAKNCLQTVLLVCFFVHHATADYPASLDRQGLSESVADSRAKLEALSHLLPFNSEQDADYKRSSSFFPLRGKKLTAADMDTASYPFMSQQGDSEEKRSQFYPLRGKKIPDELKRGSYFMPMRGRKDDDSWSEDEENVDKRMSSFMPMRGKKKSGFLDTFSHLGKPGTYSTEIMYPSSSGSNRKKRDAPWPAALDNKTTDAPPSRENGTSHSVQKRSVSFVPMRGRREYGSFGSQEIKTRLLEKKQFSFMPMRGRRYPFNDSNGSLELDLKFDDESTTSSSRNEPVLGDIDAQNRQQIDADKRAASFMPMRGRRTSIDDIASAEYSAGPQEDKRRSNFMPMRGRKNHMDDTESSDEYDIYSGDKRSSSFMPMRGRRKLVEFTDFNDHEMNSENKRASSFMPMRGRRKMVEFTNFNDYETSPDDKRASSFMPMRGRRESLEDLNSFNDFENKRGSYFMPMRGRRSVDDSFVDSQTRSLRNKRSSSFMPMRGRKMDSSFEDFLDKKSSSFMPMRGRRDPDDNLTQNLEEKRGSYFMPMRGRRGAFDTASYYNAYPYVISSGIGSSLMTRHYNGDFYPVSSVRRYVSKARKFDWDSVKRAFHATRGKRVEVGKDLEEVWGSEQSDPSKGDGGKGCRYKRSIIRPRMPLKPHRQYIALKRPMSFFATRGKRLDDSAIDSTASKLR